MTQKSLGRTHSGHITPALHCTLQPTIHTAIKPRSTLPCSILPHLPYHTYSTEPTLSRLPHLSRLARLG